MARMIKREVKLFTLCAVKLTIDNGNVMTEELPPIQTTENVTEKNAEKLFRKLAGIPTTKIMITDVSATTITYAASLDDFMKIAKVVEDNDEIPATEFIAE